MMKNYYDLATGVVIQRSSLTGQNGSEMTATLNQLIAAGKTVRVVENASEFFNDANFLAAVDVGDTESLTLIAEKRGIVLSDTELANISAFVAFKNMLRARLDALRPPYQFKNLPEGWQFDQAIRITAKGVYRAGSSDYRITLPTLERIWKHASRVWAQLENNSEIEDIRASGYTRRAVVHNDRVQVGCQQIWRHELEQLALQQGWEIPSK
jgi:hypothetical protein